MGEMGENGKRKIEKKIQSVDSFGRLVRGYVLGGCRARLVIFGGNANNVANDGVGYANVTHSLSHAYAAIGCRLSEKVCSETYFPAPNQKVNGGCPLHFSSDSERVGRTCA